MSWRTAVLEPFDAASAPLLIVTDPDGLLHDADMQVELTRRGYVLLAHDDPVAFRLAYEAAYQLPLIVALWDHERSLESVPADVVRRCMTQRIGLAELFPRLHIPMLAGLDPTRLDRLWHAFGHLRGSSLGATATAEAVLQVCYNITLAALQTPADVLALLLEQHFTARPLPPALANLLLQHIQHIPGLDSWPLSDLLQDHFAFDTFLNRAWPRFLYEGTYLRAPASAQSQIAESRAGYALAPLLPFDKEKIWPSIDTLFLAGRLKPLTIPTTWTVQAPYEIGVRREGTESRAARSQHLADRLAELCPTPEGQAMEWLTFAPLIGEAMALLPDPESSLATIMQRLRIVFASWMQVRFAALQITPPLPIPQLVSHLPYALARERMRGRQRQALVVLDGMSLDQWVVIREVWEEQGQTFDWEERALFAWIPTLTEISRQAIFAAAPPSSFAHSLGSTSHEEAHWRRFWSGQGLQLSAVRYLKGLHGLDPSQTAAELDQIDDVLATPQVQVIGLVVDAIDKIAHGMQLGEAGMLDAVRQWTVKGWLAALITRLQTSGFAVTLTADHGNVEARGIGLIDDGILAEEGGRRARIYTDRSLRDRALARMPAAVAWSGAGLPTSLSVLLAPPDSAFAYMGQYIVGHGGADLREVLVPWVTLRQ